MKNSIHHLISIAAVLVSGLQLQAQSCENMNFELLSDLPSPCSLMTMTMLHDQLDRPYLYVANKEGGLRVYGLDDWQQPEPVASISVSAFGNLQVMNLSQSGNYLYLALGNHFTSPQQSGMAIVDIAQPETPVVTDYWVLQAAASGAGIVQVEGSYAYLGAMQHGLIILDVADKADIQFVSQFIPPLNFPDANPDPAKINARGMEVKNGIVYLCYDAGGLRIIDATDPLQPEEIGRYSNPALNGLPRAYNNLVLDGEYVYVTVDYCGLEVLNVANPAQISLTGWWNPWNCQSNPLNWFVSPGHANEIAYNPDCKRLFLSTGKSDLHVLDISDPTQPDSCNFYGGVDNEIGTWGVSAWQDKVFLSYICNFLPFPFTSNWTGVRILGYENDCISPVASLPSAPAFAAFPNPVSTWLTVELGGGNYGELRVCNTVGQTLLRRWIAIGETSPQLDLSRLDDGIYFLSLSRGDGSRTERIVKGRGW